MNEEACPEMLTVVQTATSYIEKPTKNSQKTAVFNIRDLMLAKWMVMVVVALKILD